MIEPGLRLESGARNLCPRSYQARINSGIAINFVGMMNNSVSMGTASNKNPFAQHLSVVMTTGLSLFSDHCGDKAVAEWPLLFEECKRHLLV